MFISRFQCDKCGRQANGDRDDWFAIRLDASGHNVCVHRLNIPSLTEGWTHVCGEQCFMSVIGDMVRGLPR